MVEFLTPKLPPDRHDRWVKECSKWHRHFALWPRRVSDEKIQWLCWVERRLDEMWVYEDIVDAVLYVRHRFKYRPAGGDPNDDPVDWSKLVTAGSLRVTWSGAWPDEYYEPCLPEQHKLRPDRQMDRWLPHGIANHTWAARDSL